MADKLSIAIMICTFLSVATGELCTKKKILFDETFYCSNGCCGRDYTRYCCLNVGTTLAGAAIAGIVVGCVILVAIIASTILAIYCCLKRQRAGQGQVVAGQGLTTTTTTITPTAYPMNLQAPHGQAQATPAYGQAGYTNSALPDTRATNVPYPTK